MNLPHPQAFYFPVNPRPLVMKPGFQTMGTDFGNGDRDQLFFQKDDLFSKYQRVKEQIDSQRHWTVYTHYLHLQLHLKALEWMIHTQQTELNLPPLQEHLKLCQTLRSFLEKGSDAWTSFSPQWGIELGQMYRTLALRVQEDIALLANQPTSSLIMGHISMPSFWDPQRIQGASFWDIHKPVPDFPKNKQLAERLGGYIATKGPFVRFVWTITNDDRLDHHPQGGRTPWSSHHPLWLRVERQITIPFEGLGALFLIRTYLYPFDDLNSTHWDIVRQALCTMSIPIAQYKGLEGGREMIIQNLQHRLCM